jgi:hypothetical protein
LFLVVSSLTAQVRGGGHVEGAVEIVDRTAVTKAGKQWAVFIAIDEYSEWDPLLNPVKDAREIKNILLEYYYIDEVRELYNRDATAAAVRLLFRELQEKTGPADSVFVFHAGHGFNDEGTKTSAWIPYNGGTDRYAQANWLLHSQMRSMLDSLKARHVFLISDSCFSGDLLDATRGAPDTVLNYPSAYDKVSREAMSSGASEEVRDLSEFASRLKNTLLRTETAYITPDYLLSQIKEARTTRQLYTIPILAAIPRSGHQIGGSFLFFRKNVVTAQPVPEGLVWKIADGRSVTITGYRGNAATLHIPERIQGLPVTAFNSSAFINCRSLTNIIIPSSVTSIGNEEAFFGCSNLTGFTVDNRNTAYTSVDGVLFDKNILIVIKYPAGKKGTNYVIPPSVTYINYFAFSGCRSLTNITIPSSVTDIGNYAFSNCSSLTNISIPSSVTSIGSSAFRGCGGLTSVTLSRRTRVERDAFPDSARITYRD